MMTENELIKLAKSGDEKALDELYLKYKQNILFIAKKYYLNDGNNDDIVQEGMLGFLKAINTFDSKKGNFYSHLKLLVEHQIINAVKKSNSQKNHPLNDRYNLNNQGELEIDEDNKVLGIPNDTLSPESSIMLEEDKRELNEMMSGKLSAFEREVLQLYLSGFSYYDIIGENGMSGDPMVTFYEYKDKHIENLGEMYAYPYDLEMNGESIIASEETCHLQCQPVKFRYELVDGSFVKQEEEYYDYRQNIITAKQEVALYTSKEEKQVHLIIQEGEEVQVMGGDMKNWVLLRKVSTKEEGWLRVEYANCILPDGSEIYSQDLFEDIYMYG